MIGELIVLVLLWLFDSTIRFYLAILYKFVSGEPIESNSSAPIKPKTHQNDLPSEIFEFEAVEDVPESSEDRIIQRKAIQRAICITTAGDEHEADVKKWQFVCKVCNRAFDSLELCEIHILNNGHTFLSSETNQDDDFDMLRFQLEMLRKMDSTSPVNKANEVTTNGVDLLKTTRECSPRVNQNFSPIQLGNWSKVYEWEFKKTGVPDFPHLNLANEETLPKTIPQVSVTQAIPQRSTVRKETLLQSTCPVAFITNGEIGKTNEDSKAKENLNLNVDNACKETKNTESQECESSKTSIVTELSELTMPSNTDLQKEHSTGTESASLSPNTSESSTCQVDKTKVFLDYVTRLLYCEACGITFNNIEQALTHLKTDGDSEKSADQLTWDEYDIIHQMNRSDDKVQSNPDDQPPEDGEFKTSAVDDHNMDETNDKMLINYTDTNESQREPESPSEKPPFRFADTLPSTSKFDADNHTHDDNENISDSYSEKVPLFERPVGEKKQKRRKKKKKRKAWRMVKRTVMYTITFLF